MSRIFQSSYTIEIPTDARIVGNTAVWLNPKGKRITGILCKNKTRVRIKSAKWMAVYKDENNQKKVVATNTESKSTALKILHNLENDVIKIKTGLATRDDITRTNNKKLLVADLIKQFELHLASRNVGIDYAKDVIVRLKKFVEIPQIKYVEDFTAAKVESWMVNEIEKKIRSNISINKYLFAFRTFCNWLVKSDILERSPLQYIKNLNTEVDRKYYRRAFTADELNTLTTQAENQTLYFVLATTGLRINELLKSQVHQFDLDKGRYTVVAKNTKNKHADFLPLRKDTVELLRTHIKDNKLKPQDNLFGEFQPKDKLRKKYYVQLNKDLKKFNIPKINDKKQKLDLHSFRKTFGTMLARAGVPITTTQRLMRHSTIELTAKIYIEVEEIDMNLAVEKFTIDLLD
jgi:integrase